jgi:membrane-bound inhibitor of C-type lysozyme
MKKYVILSIAIIIIAVGGFWHWQLKNPKAEFTASASYLCKGNKSIEADYYKGKTVASKPDEPPIPAGSVRLKLSDGRSFALPQTISASGIRYANKDESFVFWSKGNGALVLENNEEKSYIGCVALAKDPGDLPNAFADESGSFSIRYPAGYKFNDSYVYESFGPGKEIHGIKFTIPEEMATGTNLSKYDTGVSVETVPAVQDCSAGLFLDGNPDVKTVNDNGMEISVASGAGAGAGNFYEENVFAFPGTNPCVAVRYLIHSTNIFNYPEGAVREFNKDALIFQFDKIKHSLIFVP